MLFRSLESNWIRRAERKIASSPPTSSDVQLLRQCMTGIAATQGYALAQASLSLVPSDRTRCYLALSVPWEKPRVAINLFHRLERRAQPRSLRPDILLSLASRTCHLGLFHEAREFYRASSSLNPQSPYGWVFAFNLSCFLGDAKAAVAEAVELDKTARPDDPRVLEDCNVLREWMKARTEDQLAIARKAVGCMSHELPEVARVLCQVIEP